MTGIINNNFYYSYWYLLVVQMLIEKKNHSKVVWKIILPQNGNSMRNIYLGFVSWRTK